MSVFTLSSNTYFWAEQGYFSGGKEDQPLLHTWSLAVEEQYYVLFTFILLIFFIFAWSNKTRINLCLTMIVLSFLLSVLVVAKSPSAAFYLLPTRVWELLVGATLVYFSSSTKRHVLLNETISCFGIASILMCAFIYDSTTPFPGAAALVPVLSTALIMYSNSTRLTTVGKILASRPCVFIGLISYSFYLWHWPLLVYAKIQFVDWPVVTVAVLIFCVVLSYFSWRFIELPFRTMHLSFSIIGKLCLVIPMLLVCFVWYVFQSNGLLAGHNPIFGETKLDARFNTSDEMLLALDGKTLGNIQMRLPPKHYDFIVVGDSHASMMLPMFNDLGEELALTGLSLARPARKPLGLTIDNTKQAILDSIKLHKPEVVFVIAKWNNVFDNNEKLPHYAQAVAELRGVMQLCRDNNIKFRVVTQVPGFDISRASLRYKILSPLSSSTNTTYPELDKKELLLQRIPTFNAFQELNLLEEEVVDVFSAFSSEAGKIRIEESDAIIYWDNNHLTAKGSQRVLTSFFKEQLKHDLGM